MNSTGKKQTRNTLPFFFGSLVIIALIWMVSIHYSNLGENHTYVIKQVEKQLNKSKELLVNTDSLARKIVNDKQKLNWKKLNHYFGDLAQVVVIKKGDSLIYWNHSNWPIHSIRLLTKHAPQIFPAKEGWFMGLNQPGKNFQIFLFCKLQSRFTIHNPLLGGFINGKFKLPYGVKLVNINLQDPSIITLKKFNVGIRISQRFIPHSKRYFFLGLFVLEFVLSFLLLENLFNRICGRYFHRYKWAPLFITIVLISFARYVGFLTGFPGILKQSFLFTEMVGFVPGFRTPGDIILNFTIFLLIAWFSRKLIHKEVLNGIRFTAWKTAVFLLFVFLTDLSLFIITNNILTSYDKQFLLNNSSFSNYGIIDLLFFTLLSLIIFFWTDAAVQLLKSSRLKFPVTALVMVFSGLVCAFIFRSDLDILLISWISFVLLTVILVYFSFSKNPYLFAVFVLLVFAASNAYLYNHVKQKVRNGHQEITASLLSQRNDPYFEFQFRTISRKILKDSTLRKILSANKLREENKISQYIENKYFRGKFDSYTKQFTFCQPRQQLQIQPGNQIIPCDQYFDNLPGKVVQKTPDFTLSLISNNQENIYYLATFKFHNMGTNGRNMNLYIEFFADFMPGGVGYPDFLIDSHQKILQLYGYSFSRYYNGTLQYKFGDFPYPIEFNFFKNRPIDKFFFLEHYKHIIIQTGPKAYLVVSRPRETISMQLLPFSALFLFFSMLVIIFIVVKYGRRVAKLFSFSFRARLQLVFFTSVVSVFMALSFISLYYFKENGKEQVNDYLREKSHSVMMAIQQKFENYPSITKQDKPVLQDYLQRLSQLFFTDINVYNHSGELIASSRPEIFKKGLQSDLIHPGAYNYIQVSNHLFYLSREHIGNLEFYSAYMPLTLMNGKDAGILNLPYFARQSQIQKSGFQMLANLLSLFVITGILGLIIILYLSKIMTKPLRLLQEKINLVSIEKQNEKIIWNEKDEIGQLIEAYNQMVEKLEQSAELLKHSERERAWGEMARQITHEIRNPLTPMKLNVQYLLKAYEQKDKNFDKKLKNISQALINQIEALNEVAGMFSDFSKTSLPKKEKADLLVAIKDSITLFRKSYKVNFNLIAPEEDDLWVRASSKSLMRIFNNLTKNAVQAMEYVTDKRIEVEIIPEENDITVRFTDFGKGIAPENKRRIFQPYFTTKSTGTGLGLAIVRNMMKEMDGTVTFDSEAGKGTSFYLKFRRIQQ